MNHLWANSSTWFYYKCRKFKCKHKGTVAMSTVNFLWPNFSSQPLLCHIKETIGGVIQFGNLTILTPIAKLIPHQIYYHPSCMQWLCVFIDTWLHFTVYESCLEHKYTADFMWTVILKLSVTYVRTIPRPCSNFNCCNTPSCGWQRQCLKHLLFKCTIVISLMSQLWANMNTLQVQGSLCMYIKQKDIVPRSSICVRIYTVLYILGYYSVWPYTAFSCCLSHKTCVFNLNIPSLVPRLFVCAGPGNEATIYQWSIIVHIAENRGSYSWMM